MMNGEKEEGQKEYTSKVKGERGYLKHGNVQQRV
jgi:hypothetical protein